VRHTSHHRRGSDRFDCEPDGGEDEGEIEDLEVDTANLRQGEDAIVAVEVAVAVAVGAESGQNESDQTGIHRRHWSEAGAGAADAAAVRVDCRRNR
jgi:hypothetical protein